MFTIICCLVIFDLHGLAHALIYCIHAILITKDTAESFLTLKVYFPQLLKCGGSGTCTVVLCEPVTLVCGSSRCWTSGIGRSRHLLLTHKDMFTKTWQTFLSPSAGPAYKSLFFRVSVGTGRQNEQSL